MAEMCGWFSDPLANGTVLCCSEASVRSGTVEGLGCAGRILEGRSRGRAGGAGLAAASLAFHSAVASNPNLRKPHRWFWRLLHVSMTIFHFPVPPHPTSARYDSLADGMGILPKALKGGSGAALCQLATGK